ncbi:single-stranded-DNA-specific exonuclease RecJ, partial [Paucilactobacillus nenjiangensis]|uniref:single-stranded-DNA-specific exonuclease RecJ n=1 Tax=Paucilactobacillus nenjiangensis TaxID=1296540 RepID=UPI003F9DE4AB
MLESQFNWKLPEVSEPYVAKKLQDQFKLTPTISNILVNRGYTSSETVEKFLNPQIDDIYLPDALHDIDKAVERIRQSIENGDKITIYGDYDADGITSTSVMYEALMTVGANVSYYVPNRFTDGYGPNVDSFGRLIDSGTQLFVTVDNGVSGNEAIRFANEHGVDVVVTDHHELPEILPDAFAIVHPRFPGTDYPFGDLSGVGVAFKVAWALLEEFPSELLDLVAIGEIADLVSVTDENRILITYGLKQLQQGLRPGLHELVKFAGVNEQN